MSYRNLRRRIRKAERWVFPRDEGTIPWEDFLFEMFLLDPEDYRRRWKRIEIDYPPQPLERRAAELVKSGRLKYKLRAFLGENRVVQITDAHTRATPERQMRF